MKVRNILRPGLLWLISGLALSIVQPIKGQAYTNPAPLFQYAAFYNGLMEFTDCAPLTFNGRVQCNSNIYVGCPLSASTLTFNGYVTCSGIITNPSWFGYAQSYYIASNISYNATPTPGYATNVATLNLPIGVNSCHEIINLPDANDTPSNSISLQRYYFKADLVILVTNVTPTNIATTVMVKNSMFDPTPLVFSYTNNLPANTATYTNMVTNWTWFGASNWLNTSPMFYDARQGQTNHITQINITDFGNWIATNTNVLAKWNNSTPFNGIIYVADMRTTNGMYMDAVRLTNGQVIPSLGATNVLSGSGTNTTTNYEYSIPGFTVATINPLYICGNYNCPGTNNVSSTNTTGTQPCSVVCDALTILSLAWRDSLIAPSIPSASSADTVNTAIIAGNVPSTGSGTTQFSGGVNNLPRLLEDWGGGTCTLWLNTSLVCAYPSQQATAQFQAPGIYYEAPTRKFSFDLNFNSSSGLPPGTPLIQLSPTIGSTILTNGSFQLSFANTPGASFSVLASPNPSVPLTNWTDIGSVTEVSPGQFEFTDTNATNLPQQFYIIRSP